MKAKMIFMALLAVFLAFACQKKNSTEPADENIHPQQDIPWPSLADSPWPMFHHDPQSTGRSPFTGPRKGKIKWTFSPGGTIFSTVLVAGDSSIIFPYAIWGKESGLYSLNPDGSIKWKLNIPLGSEQGPLMTSNGTLFIVGGASFSRGDIKSLYEITLDGIVKNRYDFDFEPSPYLNIGINGNLYFTKEATLYKVSQAGNIILTANSSQKFYAQRLCISNSGDTAYLFDYLTYHQISGLNAINRDGQITWKFSVEGNQHADQPPLVDSEANIYFGTFGDENNSALYAISSDGDLLWKYSCMVSEDVIIDKNGYIYFVNTQNGVKLTSLDYSGKLRWEIDSETDIAPLISDKECVIYLCSETGVSAYDSMGNLLWKVPFDAQVTEVTCPAIGYDGILYVGTFANPMEDSKLYAIE